MARIYSFQGMAAASTGAGIAPVLQEVCTRGCMVPPTSGFARNSTLFQYPPSSGVAIITRRPSSHRHCNRWQRFFASECCPARLEARSPRVDRFQDGPAAPWVAPGPGLCRIVSGHGYGAGLRKDRKSVAFRLEDGSIHRVDLPRRPATGRPAQK